MKKNFILSVILGFSSIAFADHDHTVNLKTSNLTCGDKYHITLKSTPAELKAHCDVVKTETELKLHGLKKEIKFYTDDGSYIECKFLRNKLQKCKIDD